MNDPLEARLLTRIRSDLIEVDLDFGVEGDLFAAGLDSMAIMQLLVMIEEDFGAKLPDDAIKRETFASVRQIAAAIRHAGAQ